MEVEVVADRDALAAAVADSIVRAGKVAIAERGRFCLALSGGKSPRAMLSQLARADLDWSSTQLFQVDERVAPDGDADRNSTDLASLLTDRVRIPAPQIHLMPVAADDLGTAAGRYGHDLLRATGGDGILDVVHLGIGPDGHTASWPPGDPVVDVTDRDVAVVGPFNGRLRMTLTPLPVNRARQIVFLVSGADKADVLARLVAADPGVPASRVRGDRTTVIADRPAGAKLAR